MNFQTDANIVIRDVHGNLLWASFETVPSCGSPNECTLAFQGDGNLVTYFNNIPLFNTQTGGGKGSLLVCTDLPPYLAVYNANGNEVWTTGAS